MNLDTATTTRRAEAAMKAAADLPEEPESRAIALVVAALLTPQGYGDPILVAEWILGDRPPIDKHLDDLRGAFLAEVEAEEDTETDADRAAGWYASAMGWKTRAEGAEAAVARVRKRVAAWTSPDWTGHATAAPFARAVLDDLAGGAS